MNPARSPNVEEILRSIYSEIEAVAQAYQIKDTPAGYFTLRSAIDGRVILVIEIGNNPPEKSAARCFNSQEKGARLFENKEHKLSWQSRDLESEPKRYGGAIRTKNYIYSFSGFLEPADETLCAIIPCRLGELAPEEAIATLALSSNHIGQQLIAERFHLESE